MHPQRCPWRTNAQNRTVRIKPTITIIPRRRGKALDHSPRLATSSMKRWSIKRIALCFWILEIGQNVRRFFRTVRVTRV